MFSNEYEKSTFQRLLEALGDSEEGFSDSLKIICREQPRIAEFFLTVVEAKPAHFENKVDRKKQLRILVSLFHTHPDVLDAITNDIDEQFTVEDENVQRGMIAGKLFELLAASEFRLDTFDTLDTLVLEDTEGERQKIEYRLKIAEELVLLWHNTEKYGIPLRLRNPDLAYIKLTDSGDVHIEALGEAKLGLLDFRAYAQLLDSGFKQALNTLINWLNSPAGKAFKPKLAEQGLYHLSRAEELSVDQELFVHLVLPSDRKSPEREGPISPQFATTLVNKYKFKEQRMSHIFNYIFKANGNKPIEFEDFFTLLCDETKIKYKRSQFSTEEVWAVTKMLFDEYQASTLQNDDPTPPTQQP